MLVALRECRSWWGGDQSSNKQLSCSVRLQECWTLHCTPVWPIASAGIFFEHTLSNKLIISASNDTFRAIKAFATIMREVRKFFFITYFVAHAAIYTYCYGSNRYKGMSINHSLHFYHPNFETLCGISASTTQIDLCKSDICIAGMSLSCW